MQNNTENNTENEVQFKIGILKEMIERYNKWICNTQENMIRSYENSDENSAKLYELHLAAYISQRRLVAAMIENDGYLLLPNSLGDYSHKVYFDGMLYYSIASGDIA